ncbi:MAG TPA: type IV secretory system conjugative DNA transfer family protein [Candidatus Limnocylindria bacterium]|jgi:hypothetical protein|nr:type IV secretory system conjugative DNA transfer family protein [Candidatus Limnocylindria bacterium]
MTPVGNQIARALTEQFYRWELRGRGWMLWPNRVQLEPPFRPFEGHYFRAGVREDDGQIESFGSRFAKKVGGVFGFQAPEPETPDDEDIEEPDAEAAESRGDLVELQVALPGDYKPDPSAFEQFLFSVGYAQSPLAFEVIGSAGELIVQVVAGKADAELIRRQLKAFFPEAVVTSEREYLAPLLVQEIEGSFNILELGLEREFMVPLNQLKTLATDPLVAICGAIDRLGEGEVGVFQVLIEPARSPWVDSMLRSVSLGDGKPFFANDPELYDQTRKKVARPLFAAVARVAAVSRSPDRTWELIKALSGAMRPLGHPLGNHLMPLENEDYDLTDHFDDLVSRTSRRSGMLLNSDEIVALVHLPSAAVRAKNLRRVTMTTRSAPESLTGENGGVYLGENVHEGVASDVRLPLSIRLNHCHILGGSGTGKSTLLALMACQDILMGQGIAVIDPHGDLIETLLPHIPVERLDDVILFDPSDDDYAIAFNPLAASSRREKELLATDFIAVMKQHTSAWGDQMSSLLGNAVLAFLNSTKGGTLPELRRFLSDPKFREEFLKTVTHDEVVYFWETEAQLANKSAIGSILTRLDALLRNECLLHILGQRENRLDFAQIMDGKKIFLAKLAKGLIGSDNAYILGGLLVSRFYQTAIARQAERKENRQPYMLLMDEAGELLTSTVGEILTGTRKYGLGLTLAHQSIRQLTGNEEVYAAVMGSCATRVSFQVGADDARKLAEEFGGFSSVDLLNLPTRHAIARVGPRDSAFNLETFFLPEAPRPMEEALDDLRVRTRKTYCTPREDIRKELASLRDLFGRRKAADPFAAIKAKQDKERSKGGEEPSAAGEDSATPPDAKTANTTTRLIPAESLSSKSVSEPPAVDTESEESVEKRSAKAEAIKNEIIQSAGNRGYSYKTEKPILRGEGRIDIVLRLGDREIACEISATTSAQHEADQLLHRLRAGVPELVFICDATHRRRRVEELVTAQIQPNEKTRVQFLTLKQLLASLEQIAGEFSKSQPLRTIEMPKAQAQVIMPSIDDQKALTQRLLREIQERKLLAKAKGGR